jgi:hypothetical protein
MAAWFRSFGDYLCGVTLQGSVLDGENRLAGIATTHENGDSDRHHTH